MRTVYAHEFISRANLAHRFPECRYRATGDTLAALSCSSFLVTSGHDSRDAESRTFAGYDLGQRTSNRKAQKQRAAEASVRITYQGSVASRGSSPTARQICTHVSRPNSAPVVAT